MSNQSIYFIIYKTITMITGTDIFSQLIFLLLSLSSVYSFGGIIMTSSTREAHLHFDFLFSIFLLEEEHRSFGQKVTDEWKFKRLNTLHIERNFVIIVYNQIKSLYFKTDRRSSNNNKIHVVLYNIHSEPFQCLQKWNPT